MSTSVNNTGDETLSAAQVPVLDLAAYLAGEPGALETLGRELYAACTGIGFFYIRNHGVPDDLIRRTFDQIARFHALPLDDKMRLKIDSGNIGYLPMGTSTITSSTVATANTPSQNAAFFIKNELPPDHPGLLAGHRFKGPNQWPDNLPGFRDTLLEYVDAQLALALKLLPIYATALDLPAQYFNDHPGFREPGIRVRMLHYPPQPDRKPNVFGAGPHTDYGFFTILPQSDVDGLEIMAGPDDWVRAPMMPGHFLINTADMCMRMTNGLFGSTPHRAVNESTSERYSVPLFFSPDADVVMETLNSCIGPDNPPQYEDMSYGDYFKSRIEKNYDHQQKGAA